MNRTTLLLLALATLLVHCVAIHSTLYGSFADPYDVAHVAFRIARNWVRLGSSALGDDDLSFDSYPSPLWILICAVPERLYRDPLAFSQGAGILFGLASVFLLSRFSRDRLAGVIAPLLLVFSGCFAAAAPSGTEATLLAFLITTAFLSFERRRPLGLALSTALLVGARTDGALFVLALAVLEFTGHRRARRDLVHGGKHAQRRPLFLSFLPALAVGLTISLLRQAHSGYWLSPSAAGLFEIDLARLNLGSHYLANFFLKSGSAILILFPLKHLLTRNLRGGARRALALSLIWFAYVAWTGGSDLPFWLALAPILPVFFVAVQEGMTISMDGRRRSLAQFAWASFGLALLWSSIVSKQPGNLGSLRISDAHFALVERSKTSAAEFGNSVGRQDLRNEIEKTTRLRAIGRFLRDRLEPEYSVLTPWPGAISYLAGRKVYDALGRTTSLLPGAPLRPWYGAGRVDLLEVLGKEPDYVVLTYEQGAHPPRIRTVLGEWLEDFDRIGNTPDRLNELLRCFREYELIAVPVIELDEISLDTTPEPFYLLRRAHLNLRPSLELVHGQDGKISVQVEHLGIFQLACLQLRLTTKTQDVFYVRPSGALSAHAVLARGELLLSPTGGRKIELMRFELPSQIEASQLTAVLVNPGELIKRELAQISNTAVLHLK